LTESVRGYPVHLRAVVTYYDADIDPRHVAVFVHDASGAVFVQLASRPATPFRPGMLLDITGVSGPGDFAPVVDHAKARVIGESALPNDAPLMSLSRLLTGGEDGQWVAIEGIVRSVRSTGQHIVLETALSDGDLSLIALKQPGVNYDGLVDAKVRIRGNDAPVYNHVRQMTGTHIFFPGMETVQIEEPAPRDPFSLPVEKAANLLRFIPDITFRHRTHIRGRVTMQWPGRMICIQDQTQGICAQTTQTTSLRLGEIIDVLGFPIAGAFTPTMTDATFMRSGQWEAERVSPITVEQALRGDQDAQLVQVEGKLIGEDRAAADPTLLLSEGRFVFPAILGGQASAAAASKWTVGSTLRLTGICSVLMDVKQTASGEGRAIPASFRLLLRSPRDVVVLESPSWWNARHTMIVLAGVLAITLLIVWWVVALGRRVNEQTEVIREQLQEASRLRETAEIANRAKSQFLAHMSHEIRTPMNGVLGLTELVLQTELTMDQRELLEGAKVSADVLLTVVNDILDISKIEAGKLDLNVAPFALRERLGKVAKPLALRADQKGLELTLDVHSDVPDEICGDAARLSQILENLIANAIKFTAEGEVEVTVALDSLNAGQAILHFMVRDTGAGIAADRQTAIFEAFAQADGSTTRKFGGTGLGLTICVRLAEMMGGRVWVESRPNEGSCFHFTVKAEVRAAGFARRQSEAEALAGLPVLIVDDSATSRRVLASIATRQGMKPTAASDERDALRQLRDQSFRLVLIDCQMPGVDGFWLARQIRENAGLAGVPILMLGAPGKQQDAAQCRELDLALLTKPVTDSRFAEAAQLALRTWAEPANANLSGARRTLAESAPPLSILLVEDNPVSQKVAARILGSEGYSVTSARTGLEALAAWETNKFDLILMDLQMPEMDGIETTLIIRRMERLSGAHIPIVALTAHAMASDRDACFAAGMDGFVTKPLRRSDLLSEIERLANMGGSAGSRRAKIRSAGGTA
jgi:signal transduction histidine kinase/CheY-like chemotaxis protein